MEVKFNQDSGSRDMLPIMTYYPSQHAVRISIISETTYFRYLCVCECVLMFVLGCNVKCIHCCESQKKI